MFAKLYDTDKGQIVVMLQSNDEGNPEIRFFVEPPGLGVCSMAFSFDGDDDNTWNAAEASFDKVDEAMAVAAQVQLFEYGA